MQENPLPGNRQAKRPNQAESALRTPAQYRSSIPVAFALTVVFFFFGFCSFKCNGTKVASLKGINLVMGTHLQTQIKSLNGREKGVAKGERTVSNFWAVIAFLCAIGGCVAFFIKAKREAVTGTILGGIGFLALLILRWVIKSKVEARGGSIVAVEADFLFGYWAALLSFFMAGGLSYWRLRQEKVGNAYPPKRAGNVPGATPIHINIITQTTDPSEDQ